MNLGTMERTVIKTATKKLKEYLLEQGGSKSFSITSANKWLEEQGLDFRLGVLVEDEEEKLEIKIG